MLLTFIFGYEAAKRVETGQELTELHLMNIHRRILAHPVQQVAVRAGSHGKGNTSTNFRVGNRGDGKYKY